MTEITEEMRHIPPAPALVERVGTLYRRRLELALDVLGSVSDAAVRERAEQRLEDAARWLDRVAELARPGKPARNDARELATRVRAALDRAEDALRHLDVASFRHRAAAHRFEVSGAEALWGAVLATGYAIALLSEEIARVDADFWWKVYDTSPREHLRIEA